KKMDPGEAARAVHVLVATLERSKSLSKATIEAAHGAEEAAQKIDAALPSFAALSDEVRAQRRMRDVIARSWDRALAALRREARSVGNEGSPGLYDALFGTLKRMPKKPKSTAAPASQPIPSPRVVPPATVTDTPPPVVPTSAAA